MTLLAGVRHFSSSSFWYAFLGAGAPNPLCFWTSMDIFWIARLAILVLFHQPTSASDTTEVIGAVGGSVTFRSHNPDRNVALWSFGSDPIVTVVFKSPPRLIFFEDKFKTRFVVSENGHALSIAQLRMEDAGTYSVTILDERSTFTLQVFREMAELTVTCEAQNCSGGSCSCCLRCSTPGDTGSKECFRSISSTLAQPGVESPMLQVNETPQDGLEPVTCTAWNAVSSRNVTVTNPRVLHDANAMVPPSTGAHSSSWIWISIIVRVELAVLLSIFLVSYCKYKCGTEPRGCRVGSLWGRANLLARCEEPNTWLGSKIHTKGAEQSL
ncbi:CD48 antigen-like [Melospiza melodia melodia]|uniref:CD48 antigen-like n=1 Tax=Melospiza melodia melodia TaxID=1914991 RepID=UPI002FD28554